MSKYVDELLREWAIWKRKQDDQGGGYPKKVPWIDERVQRSVDTYIPPVDPDVLRIDAAIKQLPDKHRMVIVEHYCGRGPVKAKAAIMRMSRVRWYEHVEHAQAFLEAMLERVHA